MNEQFQQLFQDGDFKITTPCLVFNHGNIIFLYSC